MTKWELAAWLGVTPNEAGVRFTLAVLRDVFTDDHAVRTWLRLPRRELGGLCALDLLHAGRTLAVESLAVREWHRPRDHATGAASGGAASRFGAIAAIPSVAALS